MKKLLIFCFLLSAFTAAAAFTEFYVQTTGDNLNAGSTTADAATFTYAGGTFVRATGVYTVASGDPASDGVAVGNWASVYTTAGATIATFIGRVTARDATTITVSITVMGGATASVSESANAATLKVGGAWKGPNAAVGFPFNFLTAVMTNASGVIPRANFKGGTDYVITAAMTHSLNGPMRFQGYTTTVGDGGKANIVDNATAASYVILTPSGGNCDYEDFIFSANFSSGTSDGIGAIGVENRLKRVVVHDVRRSGFQTTSLSYYEECEAYNCNEGNSGGNGGFIIQGTGCVLLRCISHDNAGSAAIGFIVGSAAVALIDCIADSNGNDGFQSSVTTMSLMSGCDAYNNGGDGIDLTGSSAAAFVIQNCNLVNNTLFGITSSGSALRTGAIQNCGFGSGTQTNDSGGLATNLGGMVETGSILYAADVTPWADPANGDFRISLAAAKNTGIGSFTETAPSYTGTIGFPDVGAAQAQATGGSSEHNYISFSQ